MKTRQDEAVALPSASDRRSIVELQEVSTLSAARQLVERGCDPVVLNFASAIGVHHGHESIVLGAWGCGAFRNDPAMVARRFRDALRGAFSGAYEIVVFAVLDSSETKVIYRTFEQILS